MRIFFIRHGESEANVQKIFSNRGWKHPLTEKGREQVKALGKELQGRGVVAIYTSPLRRAVESGEILGELLQAPREIEAALIEYDVGIYEDRNHEEGAQAYAAVEEQWFLGHKEARIEGGESSLEICERFEPFIHRLIDLFGRREDANLALVGHGGTFRQALPVVLANVSPAFAREHGLGNAAYVEAIPQDGGLYCLRWGDEIMG